MAEKKGDGEAMGDYMVELMEKLQYPEEVREYCLSKNTGNDRGNRRMERRV